MYIYVCVCQSKYIYICTKKDCELIKAVAEIFSL